MKKGLLFASALSLLLSSSYAAGQELLADSTINTNTNPSYQEKIQKINDDFYTAKLKDKPLWAVMERLTNKNRGSWIDYAHSEYEANHHLVQGMNLIYGTKLEGVSHFKKVIEEISHEIWIAYLTSEVNPKNSDNKDAIKIFVTVSSNPEAKITSHMGISRTVKSLQDKIPNISIDLHSFGAKVMLMHNMVRKYMIITPVPAMLAIIAKSLPSDKVFIDKASERRGKRIRDIEFYKQVNLAKFKDLHPEEMEKLYKKWEEENEYTLLAVKEDYIESQKKSNDVSPEEVIKSLCNNHYTFAMVVFKDGEFVIDDQKLQDVNEKRLREDLNNKYSRLLVVPSGLDDKMVGKDVLEFVKERPSIIYQTAVQVNLQKFRDLNHDMMEELYKEWEERNAEILDEIKDDFVEFQQKSKNANPEEFVKSFIKGRRSYDYAILSCKNGEFVIDNKKLAEVNERRLISHVEYKYRAMPDMSHNVMVSKSEVEIVPYDNRPSGCILYKGLTICNPEDGSNWLEIYDTDPTYNWMFKEAFLEIGSTRYLAVDLKALADCRELE